MATSSSTQRREEARERAAAMRKAQVAQERRRRFVTIGALGFALLVLAVAVVWTLLHREAGTDGAATGTALADVQTRPSVALADGGLPMSAEGAGVLDADLPRVDVYSDYMCPGCGTVETQNGALLGELVAEGTATVVYHPIAILDRLSAGTEYSTRSSAAAALVAEQEPSSFEAFHLAMFEAQPAENSTGLTDEEIADIARGVGVPDETADLIADGTATSTYREWVTAATSDVGTDESLTNPSAGGFTTPTIAVDGVRWSGSLSDLSDLAAQLRG
ncbi:MAG TPA: thioredoxin domain-containing protein [Cellulomonas sp.]